METTIFEQGVFSKTFKEKIPQPTTKMNTRVWKCRGLKMKDGGEEVGEV